MKTEVNYKINKIGNRLQSDYMFSLILILFIFVFFIISYINQSNLEIQEFEICINNTSCLHTLIDETQDFTLCNKAKNISSCYLTLAFDYNDSNFCDFTSNELSCIISLSLNKSYNFCEFYYGENENLIRECNFNINYYTDKSQ